MKWRQIISVLLCSFTGVFGWLLSTKASVNAQTTISQNTWKYISDPNYDSLAGDGSPLYEIFGMAIMEDNDSLYFAINSNLSQQGFDSGPTRCNQQTGQCFPISNSNIGYGDLFLDFSGTGNFATANNQQSLIGIRFASNNDSFAPGLGVWSGFNAVSVVPQNAGYSNLWNYNQQVLNKGKGDAKVGDLAWNDPYFSPYTTQGSWNNSKTLIPNVMGKPSTKLGDITMLNSSELISAGFSLSNFSATGTQTFGFKFNKSILPVGNYI